jgi:hypothetical protein
MIFAAAASAADYTHDAAVLRELHLATVYSHSRTTHPSIQSFIPSLIHNIFAHRKRLSHFHRCRSVALGTLYNDMDALAEPLLLFFSSLLCSTRFSTSLMTPASAISLALVSGGGLGVSRGEDSVTLARRSGPLSEPERTH